MKTHRYLDLVNDIERIRSDRDRNGDKDETDRTFKERSETKTETFQPKALKHWKALCQRHKKLVEEKFNKICNLVIFQITF